MSKRLEFWLIATKENDFVLDTEYMQIAAKHSGEPTLTEKEIQELYGKQAVKHCVLLKPNSYALRLATDKLAQLPDDAQGAKQCEERLPGARGEAVIEKWSFGYEPTADNYMERLPIAAFEHLTIKIFNYLYPDIARDPNFILAWQSKQKPHGDSCQA